MTWLGLVLLGFGTTDLAFSWLRRPRLAEAAGVVAVLVLGLLAGLTAPLEVLGIAAVLLGVLAWGESVTYGFGAKRYGVPLLVLVVVLTAALLATAAVPATGGALGELLDRSDLPVLAGLGPTRALLLAGVFLVQLSTGNVLVRLVLGVTGTSNPVRGAVGGAPSSALKGGRLLGPMERVFILGLGVAGELTAAGIVIAAKGLLRFPELQAARGGRRSDAASVAGAGIHEVTEYFLVGSFVSWSVSLVCLALVGF